MLLLQVATRALCQTPPTPLLHKLCPTAHRLFTSDQEAAATPNHYQVLGVDRSAGAAEIKKAFRKVCPVGCDRLAWPNAHR